MNDEQKDDHTITFMGTEISCLDLIGGNFILFVDWFEMRTRCT